MKDVRDKDLFEDLEPIAPPLVSSEDPLEARVARLEAALAQLSYFASGEEAGEAAPRSDDPGAGA